MVDQSELRAMIDWLVDGAPPPKDAEGLVAACSERLCLAGIPLEVVAINGFFVHPQIRGTRISWTAERGTKLKTFDHLYMRSPDFLDTPLADMLENPQEIRYRFNDSDPETSSRYRSAYKNLGYSDVILLPLVNTDGTVTGNVEAGTKKVGGFTEEQYDALCAVLKPIARLKEYYTERFDKRFTLSTYMGREMSQKVLKGEIVLGEGEIISAVILFADLSGFTTISNRLGYDEILSRLNTFFAAIGDAVTQRGGEILKFIGDGILVIFAVTDDLDVQRAASEEALASIIDARSKLQARYSELTINFKASLHIGDFFFGNIGTNQRLDFTAIGPAVNFAARMLEEASSCKSGVVCSPEFLETTTKLKATQKLCRFRGFKQTQKIYMIDFS